VNLQFEAAWRLHEFLTARSIPYAIIGGIAVQRWGQPRLTRDVDLTILVPPGREESVARDLVAAFRPRIAEPIDFAVEHRVLPLDVPGGSEADVSFGLPGYEEFLIDRAQPYELSDGRVVRLCSAEDLIVHKALAGRPQDLMDLESIVVRQGTNLDVAYVRRWLGELASVAEDAEVAARFERIWAKRRSTPD
jgi:hypothetical protein